MSLPESHRLSDVPGGGEEAADRILRLIAKRELSPGSPNIVSELRLSQMVGIDRSLVRQGLSILWHSGSIGQRPGSGIWIWPVSAADLQPGLELRGEMECLAADTLAAAEHQPDMAELHKRYKNLDSIATLGQPLAVDDFISADTRFHAELVREGGYPLGDEIVNAWGYKARIFFASPEHHDILAASYAGLAGASMKTFEFILERNPKACDLVNDYLESWKKLLEIEVSAGHISVASHRVAQ